MAGETYALDHANSKGVGLLALNVATVLATVGAVACGVATAGVCDLFGAGEADEALIAVDYAADSAAVAASEAAGTDDAVTDGVDAAVESCSNSFTGTTSVLLASGAAVAIDTVKVGDEVLAKNVITGKSSAKTVSKLWDNHDTDLMDVTVTSGGQSSVIHATQHHPFWDETSKTWVDADQLKAGDALLSANGATVTVASTVVVPGAHDMWDLTVQDDHDFYIVTNLTTTVLVHNCPTDEAPTTGQADLPDSVVADKIAAHADHEIPGVSKEELPEYVENLMKGPGTRWRPSPNGSPRIGWHDPQNGAIVVREGTGGGVYVPGDGTPGSSLQYFLDQSKE